MGRKSMRFTRAFLVGHVCILASLMFACAAQAQTGNSATLQGIVTDPSGAVIAGATATIHNPVSGLDRSATTDTSGNFSFPNVPYNPYHLTVTAPGFATHSEDVDIRSSVPTLLKIGLTLGQASASVTVEAAGDLLETDSTSHTRRGPATIRQASAGKRIVLGEFAGDAGGARSCGGFERSLS